MSDYTKRLAEIGALAADGDQWTAWRIMQDHLPWLLAEHRATSEALTAAGIPADMGSLAERVALLHHDADQQTALASRLMREKDAACEPTPAVDVPDDLYQAHPLIWADRVKAMASGMPDATAAVFRLAVDRAALVPGLEQANREAHQGIARLKRRLAGKRCDDCGGTDAPHGHRFGRGLSDGESAVVGGPNEVRDVGWGDLSAGNDPPTGLDVARAGDAESLRTDGPIVRRADAERADETVGLASQAIVATLTGRAERWRR